MTWNGKFYQKHPVVVSICRFDEIVQDLHLQVALLVKIPPRTGPMTDEIPKIAAKLA
jgi:hypothetical protein